MSRPFFVINYLREFRLTFSLHLLNTVIKKGVSYFLYRIITSFLPNSNSNLSNTNLNISFNTFDVHLFNHLTIKIINNEKFKN